MRGAIAASLLPLLASAAPFAASTIDKDTAPLLSAENVETIPDSYLVVFKKHVTADKAVDHHSWVQNAHLASENQRTELRKRSPSITHDIFQGMKHTYNIAGDFLGYSGHFDESVIDQVRRHPDVDFVERDSVVHILENDVEESGNDTLLEKNAPWGLARISHREPLSFGNFNKYLYAADGGEGVDVYVIDTGTNTEHVDFEGRANWGKTVPVNDEDMDGNGHGTHCSGTIAGRKYGVAKKANIYAVKVLRSNGSGSMTDVVKGVDFAAESHAKKVEQAKNGKAKGFKGSAANMSLGGGKSPALDRAVNGAVKAGIHFAVAAGNDNADSCNYSPAAAEEAITVGASNIRDERAYFSNYGKCNDIFGPGVDILSTWIGSKYATNTISGTSMASPHIAGLAAYMLSLQPAVDSAYAVAEITPKKLKANLIKTATRGALTDVPSNTGNLLAWNGGGESNYSSIVSAGGYEAKTVKVEMPSTIEELEEALENDFQVVSGKVVKGKQAVVSEAELVASKMRKIVEEELEQLEELFENLSN